MQAQTSILAIEPDGFQCVRSADAVRATRGCDVDLARKALFHERAARAGIPERL